MKKVFSKRDHAHLSRPPDSGQMFFDWFVSAANRRNDDKSPSSRGSSSPAFRTTSSTCSHRDHSENHSDDTDRYGHKFTEESFGTHGGFIGKGRSLHNIFYCNDTTESPQRNWEQVNRTLGHHNDGIKNSSDCSSPRDILSLATRETAILDDESPSPPEHHKETDNGDSPFHQSFFYPESKVQSLPEFIELCDAQHQREVPDNVSQELALYETGDETPGLVYGYWEQGGQRVVWEYHNVQVTRVPNFGFGIAVSGGRDNPHFRNGDPSIAISDVLKGGPAEGKLEVNDRLISANGISLENVEYTRAVQVLRDCDHTAHLAIKRRIVLPSTPEPQTLRVGLNRSKKKEDYGVVLGCRIYIKEILNASIAQKDGSLRKGDVILRLNNTSTENITLKEARKLIDGSKDKLEVVIRRDHSNDSCHLTSDLIHKESRSPELSDTRPNYSTQNLYVPPPTRQPDSFQNKSYQNISGKNNSKRLVHVSTGPSIGVGYSFGESNSPLDEGTPPRPPLPRPEDYYSHSSRPSETSSPGNPMAQPASEPRFVSFNKEGSVGIRLTGGNDVGIYVTAVQPKSQAQLQGLIPGDKIIKVNDMDMAGVTREEAVLYLMSLQDQIDLIVQTKWKDYQQILNSQRGDLFYIRTHFHYEPTGKSELSFRSGDIFCVVDTLHNGVVGAWLVNRIGRNNQETQMGVIPNKARAEEIATAQFNAAKKEQTQSESRSGFFKRRRNSRRSKSLGKDHWEDVVFADSVSKFPAYERVSLRHPGFVRPVVMFGPLADLATEKLLKDNPDKYASPQLDSSGEKPSGIIRLSAIREVVERGKHAVLDITPNAVDRLNYAQFYPVVVFLRVDSKQVVKELRAGCPKGRMSTKKLYDQSIKLEKLWSHVFTATVNLSQPDTWYRKMKDVIDKQQDSPIWMSEVKPSEALTDDFLFPMTSRMSYASSPESDMEGPDCTSPSNLPTSTSGSQSSESKSRMMRSSSDPSIAAVEPPTQPGPPPYSSTPSRSSISMESGENLRKSQPPDCKYGFSNGVPCNPDLTNKHIELSSKRDETISQENVPPFPTKVHRSQPRSTLSHHTSPVLRSSNKVVQSRSNPEYLPPNLQISSLSQRNLKRYLAEGSVANPKELPPKVDRSNKPGKSQSSVESYIAGPYSDANYMNTCTSHVALQPQSPYETALGPNAHDDLKSRHHLRSPVDQYKHLISQKNTFYSEEDPYSRYDCKPLPPPKNANYKPIPPPKPKSCRGQTDPGLPFSKGQDVTSFQATNNGKLSDDYSGMDSGQGSSLDRNYDTLGRNLHRKVITSVKRTGYFPSIPNPREDRSHSNARGDLPNHDHRGSAFELYRKPSDPRLANVLPQQQLTKPPPLSGVMNAMPHYVN